MIVTMAVDDLYAARGEKVEAFDTVYIYWGGSWYELHLTKGNIAKMGKDLRPYLEVARKSEGPAKALPKDAEAPKRHAAKKARYRTPRKDWGGFKAWCDANGRSYVSPSGHWSPKAKDIRDYEQWLADREGGDHAGQPAPDTANAA